MPVTFEDEQVETPAQSSVTFEDDAPATSGSVTFSDDPKSNEELRKEFEAQEAKGLGQRALELPGHVWQGVKGAAEPFLQTPAEMGEASAQPSFGRRLLSTVTHGKAKALRGLADFAMGIPLHQVEKAADQPGKAALSYVSPAAAPVMSALDYLGITGGSKEERWKKFQEHYFRKLAEAENMAAPPTALERAATTIAEPFSNIAEAAAGEAAPLPHTADALSTTLQLAVPEAALGVSGKVAKALDAGRLAKGAELGGKAAQVVGRGAEKLGELPKNVAEKVTTSLLGEEAGAAAKKAADTVELASIPAAIVESAVHGVGLTHAIAATKGLSKVGAGVKNVGEVAEAMAKAPPNSIWGRMHAVATSETSPGWMKTLLSNRPAKAIGEAANIGVDLAKGAAGGGAIGAVYGLGTDMSPEELAESIGGGAALGAGVHGTKIPGLRNRQILQRTAKASADLLKQHLEEGVSPEALKSIPDSAWTMAAAFEQYPGVNAKVRFVSPEQFAALKTTEGNPLTAEGAGGVWDRQRRTIWVDSSSKRGVDTLIHEMAHPIFDAAVLRQPEIATAVERSLAEKGQTIDDLKRTYIESLMGREISKMDLQTRQAAVQNRINAYDAAFPNNSWVISEALAENFVNSFKTKDVLNLDPTVAGVMRDMVKNIFGGKENARGFFSDFENVVQSPELAKLSRGLLKATREHRPGLDTLGGKSQGVELTPDMFGKRPEAPLHKMPDGSTGNDYLIATPDGIKPRPASAVRRIIKDRVAAVRSLFNKDKVLPLGDTSPEVSYRRTRAGGEEIAGTKLPSSFDSLSVYSQDTKNIKNVIQEAIDTGKTLGSWVHQIASGSASKTWAAVARATKGAFSAKFHDFQPFGWFIDKQGNVLVRVFDRQALNAKLSEWSNRKGLLSLEQWGGDQGKAMRDIQTYLDNHAKGLKGEDNGVGADRANTINALLTGGNEKNPLREHMKGQDRQGIVRSFRLDRIETIEPSQQPAMTRPQYGKLVENYSPDEVKSVVGMPAEEYLKFVSGYKGRFGGGQTGWSFEVGSRIKSMSELAELRTLNDKLRADLKQAMKSKDMDSATMLGSKAQAMREAYEAATNETLDGRPSGTQEFINQYFNKDFKSPMPAEVRTPEHEATQLANQAAIENKTVQLFRPKGKDEKPPAVEGILNVYHFSDFGSRLRSVDPKFMRNVHPSWGSTPRSFFFVEGSDRTAPGTHFTDRSVYSAKIDGSKIYDASKGDPLGFFKDWPNGVNDAAVQKAGFEGVFMTANGGKDKLVLMYKPTKVKLSGRTEKGMEIKPVDEKTNVDQMQSSYARPEPVQSYSPAKADVAPIGAKEEAKVARLGKRIPAILNIKRSAGVESPGITFSVAKGQERKNGFAVSTFPELSKSFTIEEFNNKVISDFLRENLDILENPETAFGIWDDSKGSTGKVWLDVVATLPDRAIAEFAGKKYNQAAIGDISKYAEGKDGTISTGGTGEAPANMLPIPERLKALKEEYKQSTHEPIIQGTVTATVPKESTKSRTRQAEEADKLDVEHVTASFDMAPFLSKVINHFRTLPGFKNIEIKGGDNKAALREISNRMEQNLTFLYEKATPAERADWKQWYDYAKTMSQNWGKDFGADWRTVAAMNAKLSPQMNWYDNVTLTRTILQTIKDNPAFTEADRAYLNSKFNAIKSKKDKNFWKAQINAIPEGQKLSEMTNEQGGAFIRSHNELKGDLQTHDHNLDPIPGRTGWGKPYQDLADTLSIYRDPSRANVNDLLGNNHKVRSFYNNHVAPESPNWTTIDTHAMAAALLLPIGSTSKATKFGFGGAKHAASGYNGSYFLYQHAYEQVAKRLGILPRELQSIVWEKMRQLLSPEAKRSLMKDPATLNEIHKLMDLKHLTPEQGRERILKAFDEAQPTRLKKKPEAPSLEDEPF